MSLTGIVCGQAVNFSTTAGRLIQLSRSSLLFPLEEITTVLVKDDPSDFSPHLPEYFDDFSLLFNVALEEGG
ncbi:MAG TPA: hypothetical protein VJU61_09315, partial [Polyangiaceae bacterium]|nr:hypothetical protein [Polyangiaceae bacterium]